MTNREPLQSRRHCRRSTLRRYVARALRSEPCCFAESAIVVDPRLPWVPDLLVSPGSEAASEDTQFADSVGLCTPLSKPRTFSISTARGLSIRTAFNITGNRFQFVRVHARTSPCPMLERRLAGSSCRVEVCSSGLTGCPLYLRKVTFIDVDFEGRRARSSEIMPKRVASTTRPYRRTQSGKARSHKTNCQSPSAGAQIDVR